MDALYIHYLHNCCLYIGSLYHIYHQQLLNYFHFLYTHFVYIHHFYIVDLLDKVNLYLICLLNLAVLLPLLELVLVKMFFALFFLMKKILKMDLMEEILMVLLVIIVLEFLMEDLVVILVLIIMMMIRLEDSYTELIPFP